MSPEEQPSRKHLRFKPDPLEYAQVSLDAESAEFSPAFVALIVEESPVSGQGIPSQYTSGWFRAAASSPTTATT